MRLVALLIVVGIVGSCEAKQVTPQPTNFTMKHSVGGKTVTEAFPDRLLAELATAACAGDTKAVTALIGEGVDPNAVGLDGVTPLIWAQRCESLPGVHALLDVGANPNATFAGCSGAAVCFAATMTDPRFLQLLLARGGDPNSGPFRGHSALHLAFEAGLDQRGWEKYYALLDAGADIEQVEPNGKTIAEFAVNMNSFDKVAELLERGYHFRLEYLGWMAQQQIFGGSPSAMQPVIRQRDLLVQMLKERGVKFPITAVPNDAPFLSGVSVVDPAKR